MAKALWRWAIPALLGTSLLATALPAASAPAISPHAAPGPLACTTAAVSAALHLTNVTVDAATPDIAGSFTPPGTTTPITGLPAFCDVNLTHVDQAGNPIHVEAWLPQNWNGRFEGVGGGGYSCGISYGGALYGGNTGGVPSLAAAITAGYAAASTDCGHTGVDGSFALTASGTLNEPLITDFASTGIHDMTVDGKALTAAFYQGAPTYAYFDGCSTGGREGLMEAQRYPADYNGIMAGSPAINWTRFIPAEIWPELVMNASHDFLPSCKEAAFTTAVVAACDGLDGVTDGVISDPAACHWDPHTLVGTSTPCGTITATDADVMAKIWQGPRSAAGSSLWFGLEPGASLSGLGLTTTALGVTTGAPFPISTTWLGTWLQQNPNWDWHTLTYDQFDSLFAQSVNEFSSTIATDNPDLSAFARRGGKIVVWHGLSDQLIFPQGSVDYYQNAQQANGGAALTASFARLFLAPGAGHCFSAAGPAPTDPFAAVVSWVEHANAPASLPAALVDPTTGTVTRTRLLCAYPLVARYTGQGSTNDASNFRCAPTY